MEEQILIQGKAFTNKKVFRYFLTAGCILTLILSYAFLLYHWNIRGCHYTWTPDSCFLQWEYSFREFLKRCLGPDTFFVSLTLLLWGSAIGLLTGACLYLPFWKNEITVTSSRIYGRAALATQVIVPLSSVLNAVTGPGDSVKLNLFSGNLLFGGIKNKKEVCAVIQDHLKNRETQEKQPVQIGSRGLSTLKLAGFCFLPFLLSLLPILFFGEPSLKTAWESYRGWERIQTQFRFLSFWLAEKMRQPGSWPSSLIYFTIPLLLSGGFFFFACSRQKILVTDRRVLGSGSFRAAFDLPLSQIRKAEAGCLHSVILYHTQGKIRINGIRNRGEVLQVLENSIKEENDNTEFSEADNVEILNSRSVSDIKLAFLCLLPVFLFMSLLAIGVYRNITFCRELFQISETIRMQYPFPEYLLILVLSGTMGRWIKVFFWLSLVGIYAFPAYRLSKLTVQGRRIFGRSKCGGSLDTCVNSVKGFSAGPLGKLTLYTDSGKFIFPCIKNKQDFYKYFSQNL